MVVQLFLMLVACQGQDLANLLEQLGDDAIERREAAVLSLARLGPSARPKLLPLRTSSDPDLARLACRAIGMIDWEPYLPAHGRPSDVVVWEQLGSGDFETFLAGFQKIVSDAKQGLGLSRKFHDEPDEGRKKLYLPHIGPFTVDRETLYRWAEELPEDTFWGGNSEFGDQLLYFFGSEDQPLKPDFWERLLRGSNRSCRLLAAQVLGRRNDNDGLDALIEFVDDPQYYVPYRAVGILRNQKYRPAREKLLAAATKEGGEINAFYAMDEFGWAGAQENLRIIAARGDYCKVEIVHRELIKLGDRSFLPGVIARLKEGKGFLLFDRGFVAAALLYDTPETFEAVLDRFSRVDHWGAHGMDEHFTFGPAGTRLLWERFIAECKQGTKDPKCGMYLYNFTDPVLLTERVREALKGDSPAPVKALCFDLLFKWGRWRSLPPEDLDLLRSHGMGNPRAEHVLLNQKDHRFREILLGRLEKEPSSGTLAALLSYGDPGLGELCLKYSDGSFSPEIGVAALRGISKCGAKAVPTVVAALADPQAPVRDAALSILPGFDPTLLRGHEDVLEQCLRKSEASYYQPKALDCLAVLDPRRAGIFARESLKASTSTANLLGTSLDVLLRKIEPGDADLARPHADNSQPNISRPALEVLLVLHSNDAWPALRRALLDRNEDRRKMALKLAARSGHPEAASVLAHSALTDSYYAAEVAIEALARLGGPDAEAFVHRCAQDTDRGRPVPPSWPIVAAMLRVDSILPSLLKRMERSPDRAVLWAVDGMTHRNAYAATPAAKEQTIHCSTFAEATRKLATLFQLQVSISPALEVSIREQQESHEPKEGDHVVPCFDIDLSRGLLETLRLWKPRIEMMHYSNGGACGWTDEILWAHVLEGNNILFLTPEEARDRLMKDKR